MTDPLHDAVDRIGSGKAKDRLVAVATLRAILRHDGAARRGPPSLSAADWRRVLLALLRMTRDAARAWRATHVDATRRRLTADAGGYLDDLRAYLAAAMAADAAADAEGLLPVLGPVLDAGLDLVGDDPGGTAGDSDADADADADADSDTWLPLPWRVPAWRLLALVLGQPPLLEHVPAKAWRDVVHAVSRELLDALPSSHDGASRAGVDPLSAAAAPRKRIKLTQMTLETASQTAWPMETPMTPATPAAAAATGTPTVPALESRTSDAGISATPHAATVEACQCLLFLNTSMMAFQWEKCRLLETVSRFLMHSPQLNRCHALLLPVYASLIHQTHVARCDIAFASLLTTLPSLLSVYAKLRNAERLTRLWILELSDRFLALAALPGAAAAPETDAAVGRLVHRLVRELVRALHRTSAPLALWTTLLRAATFAESDDDARWRLDDAPEDGVVLARTADLVGAATAHPASSPSEALTPSTAAAALTESEAAISTRPWRAATPMLMTVPPRSAPTTPGSSAAASPAPSSAFSTASSPRGTGPRPPPVSPCHALWHEVGESLDRRDWHDDEARAMALLPGLYLLVRLAWAAPKATAAAAAMGPIAADAAVRLETALARHAEAMARGAAIAPAREVVLASLVALARDAPGDAALVRPLLALACSDRVHPALREQSLRVCLDRGRLRAHQQWTAATRTRLSDAALRHVAPGVAQFRLLDQWYATCPGHAPDLPIGIDRVAVLFATLSRIPAPFDVGQPRSARRGACPAWRWTAFGLLNAIQADVGSVHAMDMPPDDPPPRVALPWTMDPAVLSALHGWLLQRFRAPPAEPLSDGTTADADLPWPSPREMWALSLFLDAVSSHRDAGGHDSLDAGEEEAEAAAAPIWALLDGYLLHWFASLTDVLSAPFDAVFWIHAVMLDRTQRGPPLPPALATAALHAARLAVVETLAAVDRSRVPRTHVAVHHTFYSQEAESMPRYGGAGAVPPPWPDRTFAAWLAMLMDTTHALLRSPPAEAAATMDAAPLAQAAPATDPALSAAAAPRAPMPTWRETIDKLDGELVVLLTDATLFRALATVMVPFLVFLGHARGEVVVDRLEAWSAHPDLQRSPLIDISHLLLATQHRLNHAAAIQRGAALPFLNEALQPYRCCCHATLRPTSTERPLDAYLERYREFALSRTQNPRLLRMSVFHSLLCLDLLALLVHDSGAGETSTAMDAALQSDRLADILRYAVKRCDPDALRHWLGGDAAIERILEALVMKPLAIHFLVGAPDLADGSKQDDKPRVTAPSASPPLGLRYWCGVYHAMAHLMRAREGAYARELLRISASAGYDGPRVVRLLAQCIPPHPHHVALADVSVALLRHAPCGHPPPRQRLGAPLPRGFALQLLLFQPELTRESVAAIAAAESPRGLDAAQRLAYAPAILAHQLVMLPVQRPVVPRDRPKRRTRAETLAQTMSDDDEDPNHNDDGRRRDAAWGSAALASVNALLAQDMTAALASAATETMWMLLMMPEPLTRDTYALLRARELPRPGAQPLWARFLDRVVAPLAMPAPPPPSAAATTPRTYAAIYAALVRLDGMLAEGIASAARWCRLVWKLITAVDASPVADERCHRLTSGLTLLVLLAIERCDGPRDAGSLRVLTERLMLWHDREPQSALAAFCRRMAVFLAELAAHGRPDAAAPQTAAAVLDRLKRGWLATCLGGREDGDGDDPMASHVDDHADWLVHAAGLTHEDNAEPKAAAATTEAIEAESGLAQVTAAVTAALPYVAPSPLSQRVLDALLAAWQTRVESTRLGPVAQQALDQLVGVLRSRGWVAFHDAIRGRMPRLLPFTAHPVKHGAPVVWRPGDRVARVEADDDDDDDAARSASQRVRSALGVVVACVYDVWLAHPAYAQTCALQLSRLAAIVSTKPALAPSGDRPRSAGTGDSATVIDVDAVDDEGDADHGYGPRDGRDWDAWRPVLAMAEVVATTPLAHVADATPPLERLGRSHDTPCAAWLHRLLPASTWHALLPLVGLCPPLDHALQALVLDDVEGVPPAGAAAPPGAASRAVQDQMESMMAEQLRSPHAPSQAFALALYHTCMVRRARWHPPRPPTTNTATTKTTTTATTTTAVARLRKLESPTASETLPLAPWQQLEGRYAGSAYASALLTTFMRPAIRLDVLAEAAAKQQQWHLAIFFAETHVMTQPAPGLDEVYAAWSQALQHVDPESYEALLAVQARRGTTAWGREPALLPLYQRRSAALTFAALERQLPPAAAAPPLATVKTATATAATDGSMAPLLEHLAAHDHFRLLDRLLHDRPASVMNGSRAAIRPVIATDGLTLSGDAASDGRDGTWDPAMREIEAECLWRNRRWDDFEAPTPALVAPPLTAVRGFHGRVARIVSAPRRTARAPVADLLADAMAQHDGTATEHHLLAQLHATSRWMDRAPDLPSAHRCLAEQIDGMARHPARVLDGHALETLMALQTRLIENRLAVRGCAPQLRAKLAPLLPWLARRQLRQSAAHGRWDAAQALINAMPDGLRRRPDVEQVAIQCVWHRGLQNVAIHALEGLATQPATPARQADVATLLAQWTATTRAKGPRHCMALYDQALARLAAAEARPPPPTSAGALDAAAVTERSTLHHQYATFLDAQAATMKSDETMARLEQVIAWREQELQQIRAMGRGSAPAPETQRHLAESRAEIAAEKQAVQAHRAQLAQFTAAAIDHFAWALSLDPSDHSAIFTVTKLWFDAETTPAMAASLLRIPSHQWLPLAYQLAARLQAELPHPPAEGDEATLFKQALATVVRTALRDHPYHLIFPIECIRHRHREAVPASKSRSRSRSSTTHTLSTLDAIVEQLAAMDPRFRALLPVATAYRQACRQLGQLEHPANESRPAFLVPVQAKLRTMGAIALPVSTATLPVEPSAAYAAVPTMHAYGPSYRLAGGRSRPKILTVTDTRGVVHRQILKAHDDLRQDAIIANLFTIMNRLFERHPDCKGRQLAIRTYNIVPLASSLGLVEWVDGAEVMYTCLERLYRRTQLNTWSLEQCRRYASQQMDVLVQPVDACVAAFHEIQRHVPPVLRLAFYESFTSIQHWLAQRDRYTNSVAATSIAGFVVGLGDRHLSNIMLHSQSGEVVHIDLGIAFGQGKILRVPERVPFRLTANLVDALGTLGAAGGFEQQCIRVLTALRESPLAIETTLDILRYAPLSTWLPAHVATRLERDERDEAVAGDAAAPATRRDERNQGSKAAMHAALSVRRRLTSAVSVRSQVRDLIAEACDARNLAQMFRGWQSWL